MHSDMRRLYKEDETLLTNKEDIENEVLGLYGNLMGKENDNMEDTCIQKTLIGLPWRKF